MSTVEFEKLNEEISAYLVKIKKDNTERRQDKEVTRRRLQNFQALQQGHKSLVELHKVKVENNDISAESLEIIKKFNESIKQKLKEISSILNPRLTLASDNLTVDKDIIETNISDHKVLEMDKFCFKTASSLLPKLNDRTETVNSLIDGIDLYNPSLNVEGKILLINYVLKACIPYKDRIRLKSSYDNIEQLISDIKLNFLPRQSAPVLASKLQSMRQDNLSIDEYARAIEKLMADLTLAQGGSDPKIIEIFRQENEKVAIDVFTNGVRNTEIRTILKAKGFGSLSEAINVAKDEALRVKQHQPSIFQMRGHAHSSRGRPNFRQNSYNFQNNSRQTGSYDSSRRNNIQNPSQNPNTSFRHQNHYSHNYNRSRNYRGNQHQSTSRGRGGNFRNQRVFTMNTATKSDNNRDNNSTFFRAPREESYDIQYQ